MKTREQKAQEVSELNEQIGKASNAFLIDFKGITVPQVTELRKQVRQANSGYVVVKNTLALIALKDSPIINMKEQFTGPTAIAFNATDAVVLAKALTKFAKDVPAVSFKGALLNGQVVPASEIQNIANLPSREELVAKLLYLLNRILIAGETAREELARHHPIGPCGYGSTFGVPGARRAHWLPRRLTSGRVRSCDRRRPIHASGAGQEQIEPPERRL